VPHVKLLKTSAAATNVPAAQLAHRDQQVTPVSMVLQALTVMTVCPASLATSRPLQQTEMASAESVLLAH
jgi:GTP cyclohydrolase FolE2